jgi:MFS family permease
LPAGVWALGLVSLFMDTSSEMVHGLLPAFLVGALGATPLAVGLIDGFAEATVHLTRLVSGIWSDRSGRRKPLLVLGYGIAAASKPLFPLATSAWTVLGARLLDRFGKGIRGAPRDALVADITPPDRRGAAYGLRQAMDTVGAVLGPTLAIVLMLHYANDFRSVFAWAVVPALLSVLTIFFLVREPAHDGRSVQPLRQLLARERLRALGSGFWWVLLVGAVLGLARFSEAFLLLRVQAAGVRASAVPATLIVMNLVYALSSYPAGGLSDRLPRSTVLALACVLLVAAQVSLALPGLAWAVIGVALWGLHMGASQGVLSALVADACSGELRGTAFGLFNLVSGMATLLASAAAGALWTYLGAVYTFAGGAVLAAAAALLLLIGGGRSRRSPRRGPPPPDAEA